MTDITLAAPEPLWNELLGWLDDPNEVAGVLIARVIDDDVGTTLLARELHRSPDSTYLDRRPDGISLRSSGWVPAVRHAARDGAMAVFIHTHPGGLNAFSRWDDIVDRDLAQPFMDLTGIDLYGSLVVAGGNPVGFAGRVAHRDGSITDLDRIRIVGDQLSVLDLDDRHATVHDVHDRQVRALGAAGQRVLGGLRVGVVGAGGTGSPVIEQLLRLGVGHLVVIDDDIVTPSTVARGYGTTAADIGRPKVEVMAAHAERLGLGTDLRVVQGNLRERHVVGKLRHCDVVFCCVDGHAARVVLNRWAYWHLAPVIDVAVLVSSTNGAIDSIDGRLTWLSPGAACLLCRGRIDPRLAHVEQLDPEERRRLAEQGYAPELDEPQPSIVTYTSLMASLATTELLSRLFNLVDPEPTEILLQLHTRSTSLNRRPSRDGCFCATPARWGHGQTEPYLDLTWRT